MHVCACMCVSVCLCTGVDEESKRWRVLLFLLLNLFYSTPDAPIIFNLRSRSAVAGYLHAELSISWARGSRFTAVINLAYPYNAQHEQERAFTSKGKRSEEGGEAGTHRPTGRGGGGRSSHLPFVYRG